MKARYDDLDEYIADLKAEIAQNEQCATHYYNLGLALLTKRDFVAAEEALLNAVRNSPHLAEAYVQLGGICLERGDLDGCLRYNEEAANCRAKFPVPWGNICLCAPAARRARQGHHGPEQGPQVGSQLCAGPECAFHRLLYEGRLCGLRNSLQGSDQAAARFCPGLEQSGAGAV